MAAKAQGQTKDFTKNGEPGPQDRWQMDLKCAVVVAPHPSQPPMLAEEVNGSHQSKKMLAARFANQQDPLFNHPC